MTEKKEIMTEPKGLKPILVKGKYNEALVFAKAIEANCEDKLRQYLDHPAFADTKVRVMCDVHLGKSAVVGFTATSNELVIPSFVGVDIGCGVCACDLGKGSYRFDKLDAFIRRNIPAGMDVHGELHGKFERALAFIAERETNPLAGDPGNFKNALRELCEKQKSSVGRVFSSLGTLGGGNHFIEIDSDAQHRRWLLIHSGSRVLGSYTAGYHETMALRETPETSPIKYLAGASAEDYLSDMALVQLYATLNRALMAMIIAEGFFKIDMRDAEYRDSVHNYIDFAASVIRKGAISARKDEKLVIPFSMSEGAILGRGRGNSDWNNSAPHGAGRKASRTQSGKGLSLDEYRKQMKGIWSSTVCKDTLDESPMAYKRPRDILECIADSVEVEQRLKPLYNFKAVD
ncbi:MAG: RtcB family protein [Spirochaetales bacterium]|jgi:RNA-splicing ligase RtcB|nr:RtcB family protein [Spirochaetales bacterium]